MNDETIILTDPEVVGPQDRRPEVLPQPKVQLRSITGGQGGDGNWLADMDPGTVFLARPKRNDIVNANQPARYLATEFQVVYKTLDDGGLWIRLATNLEANPVYLWVNSIEFCLYNDLKKVLATPADIVESKEEEEEDADSADNSSE